MKAAGYARVARVWLLNTKVTKGTKRVAPALTQVNRVPAAFQKKPQVQGVTAGVPRRAADRLCRWYG
jgi:hypothetical protein